MGGIGLCYYHGSDWVYNHYLFSIKNHNMLVYIIIGVLSFIGGCLVTANNPALTNSIRKVFGK